MKACRILTPFWAIGEGDEEEEEKGRGRQGTSYGGGGVAFAVQPHREVRPESGLVGIVEHIEVNKR